MKPHSSRGLPLLALAAATLVGCTGSCQGCAGLTPFPGGAHFVGPREENAVNLRLTAAGLGAVSASWPLLVEALAPGGTLHLPVGCQKLSLDTGIPLVGVQDFYLADQGQPGGAGRSDGVCDARDQPADVAVTIQGLALSTAGGKLEVALTVGVNTGTLYFTNPGVIRCDLACRLGFDSSAAPSTLTAAVRLSIDPTWDRLLAFTLDRVDGTQICGAAGAPRPPGCLDASRLSLGSSPYGGGGFCLPVSWGCDLLGLGFLKDLLLQALSPTLQSALQGALASQACQACGAGQPACPAAGGVQSTCGPGGVCLAPGGACVPRFLGTEGRLDLGSLLGALGAPSAPVDLSLAAGGSVTVDTGLSLGTIAGLRPVQVASCVPAAPPPTSGHPAAPDFDREATPGSGYHLGLSLSADFLGRFLWSAEQSGALCLTITSASVSLVNTGLFKAFLPSLGLLATAEGLDAPMMILLRPTRAPSVAVGKGTVGTGAVGEPLVTLGLQDLALDFYALIEHRQVRLFTLTVDLSLPLSLVFQGCDQVLPVLGDLGMAVTNVRASPSELLAEDPAVLARLVPAVVSLAQPALVQGLSAITLPAVAGFRLQGTEARGLGAVAGSARFEHLGLFTRLVPASTSCGAPVPKPTAQLTALTGPTLAELRGSAAPPRPEAVLAVATPAAAGTAEYSVRVDDGLWSTFAPAVAGAVRVSQPRLLFPGAHTVSVRARVAEDPAGVSEVVEVPVLVEQAAGRVR